ncbi:MAG TPA: DUF934 domain-containing protein [Polyangiales bacterium]|nr:DUF934 domain-containing protein [Polyangiales bacterium]
MQIIRQRKIVEDSFVHVPDGAELPESGDLILSLERYRELRPQLQKRGGQLGVRLHSDQEAKLIADLVPELAVVAIEFPGFKDGRGYTTARLLRERFGFRGEIRAVGDVLRDQLYYMERCGFTAFELKAGKDIDGALQAFSEFSVTYQGATDDPRPLFRRR